VDISLSHDEKQLLNEILSENTTVEVIVPKDSLDEVLWHQLSVCLRAAGFFQRASIRIRPIIGRIFAIIRQRPDMYKSKGYTSFNDFIKKYVYAHLGISRTIVYECLQIADKFPSLPLKDYDELGATKLKILSRFTNQTAPSHRRHIDKAKDMTITQFEEWASKQNLIDKGETRPAVITIPTDGAICAEWAKFANNGNIHKAAGAIGHGHILRAMMQECASSWGVDW
jgi:hypothetical protein